VVSSFYIVVRISFLGRVVWMAVWWDFVRVGAPVCGRSKDTHASVRGYK
jgi:hypothetical protein